MGKQLKSKAEKTLFVQLSSYSEAVGWLFENRDVIINVYQKDRQSSGGGKTSTSTSSHHLNNHFTSIGIFVIKFINSGYFDEYGCSARGRHRMDLEDIIGIPQRNQLQSKLIMNARIAIRYRHIETRQRFSNI